MKTPNRTLALGTSNYLRTILSSVLGRDMADQMYVRAKVGYSDDRDIVVHLTLSDAQRLADALNKEPQ